MKPTKHKLLRKKEHSKQSTSRPKQEGRKKMKPEARKLQKAINNNNVFRAVRFTCVTARKSERSQKSADSAFPIKDTIPHQLPACNLRHAGVLACKKQERKQLIKSLIPPLLSNSVSLRGQNFCEVVPSISLKLPC